MSNLFKSKFFLGMMVVATLLVGVVAVNTAAASTVPTCTITSTLKVGSKGAQVKCLQSTFLSLTADGNFGPKTKVAVVAWQKTVGLTADGVFGPKSRAVWSTGSIVSVTPVTVPSDCTNGALFSPSTGHPCTGTPVVTQGTGPVSVSLSSDNPASGYVINNQATADLAHFTFTGSGTVTSVTLQRTGISDQNTLDNVYLFQGNTRLTDGYSFNNTGVLTMNGLSIAVNGSTTISVKADVNKDAGNTASTIGVNLTSYTAGATATAVNLAGNSMYIGTGTPATAYVGVNTSTGTQSVNAGTSAYTVWSAPIQVNTRAVWLKGADFRVTGSAPVGSLANIKLFVDGSQVGTSATMGMITGSNYAMFDFSASPVSLSTGSHTVSVEADVASGASYTVQVALQQASDLTLYDSQVGINIASEGVGGAIFSANTGANITIAAGSASVNVDPTFQTMTNITGGATNVAIARFKVHGYGEPVKVTTLNVLPNLANCTTTDTTHVGCYGLQNVALYFNGSQVGSSTNWVSGSGSIAFNLGSQMIIPAGTDSYIEIRADLQNNDSVNYTAGTVSANLAMGTNNAQGQTSNTTLSFPTATVTGTVLSVQTGLLAISPDNTYASQTVSPNTAGAVIGSYVFQNQSTSESVRVTQLQVNLTGSTALTNLSNLRTSETSGSGSNPIQPTANNTFSVNFTLAPGATKTVQILADTGASITSGSTLNVSASGATLTGGVNTVSAVPQVDTATITGTSGTYSLTVGSNTYAVPFATDLPTTATNLAAAVNADANVSAAKGTGNTVVVTARTAGTPFNMTNYGSVPSTQVVVVVTTPNTTAVVGHTASGTVTFTGAPAVGDVASVTIHGYAYTATAGATDTAATLATTLAAAIQAATGTNGVGATSVAGSGVITITSTATGTAANYNLSATGTTLGGNVQTHLIVTSIGVTSNVSTTSATKDGQVITLQAGQLATPTANSLSSNSTAGQYVSSANGVTNATDAIFTFTSANGPSTITELTFKANDSTAGLASSVTVNGLTAPFVGGLAYLTGLNIAVPNGGSGVNQDVYVSYATVGTNGVVDNNTNYPLHSYITLMRVKYQSGGTTTTIPVDYDTTTVLTTAPTMTLVGSAPTIAVLPSSTSLAVGTLNVANVTVTANTQGSLNVNTIPLVFTGNAAGTTTNITAGAYGTTNLVIDNGSGSPLTNYSVAFVSCTSDNTGATCGGANEQTNSVLVTFTNPGAQVSAGTTSTFEIQVPVSAVAGASASLSTGLGAVGSFTWTDTTGGGTAAKAASATTMPSYTTSTVSIHN